ncbi:MAG TPA: DUF2934 domain-containing protein [Blastocatellia bacterium]|nr:DUF2934 domain-containing protein [Blastocatellia bacterium]
MKTQMAPQTKGILVPTEIRTESTEAMLESINEIYQAVERRAYELFEERGREPGHDLEDWIRAEQELLFPVQVTLLESDHDLKARAEVPGFNADQLHVAVEPRRLVITGKAEQQAESIAGETETTERRYNAILHSLDLPVEIDPASARVALQDGALNITALKTDENDLTE